MLCGRTNVGFGHYSQEGVLSTPHSSLLPPHSSLPTPHSPPPRTWPNGSVTDEQEAPNPNPNPNPLPSQMNKRRKEAEDTFRRNQELLHESRDKEKELAKAAGVTPEDAARRAKYLKGQCNFTRRNAIQYHATISKSGGTHAAKSKSI